MAVMRNSIIFGGVDSADFGIYIGGEGTFNAPKRDVEMISIPGRNGAFALDKGRFENIKVTYSAFNFEEDLATFAQNLSDLRNAICSQKGYQRLTDTFHPDEYRMAAYVDGLDIKPIDYNTASTFDITFDCKPQRYLLSGEEPVTIGEWGETETESGTIASFEAKEGDAVKSLVVDIEPLQSGSGTPSPTNIRPISGYDSVVVTVADDHDSPTVSNTYTTNLNGTRYGGTLDVASGVLTVTHVAVDMGSLTWEVWPGYTSIFRCGLPSGCKTVGNQGVPNWLCSAYVVTSGVSVSSTIGSIGQLHASYVLANNPSYTDASAFKTAMTGQTLVYELATPTTVQLTAQEVELLVGLNQVWASSGDVSVEYGTAPNVVYNPTLFESSPLLMINGTGEVVINGDEAIRIIGGELGPYVAASGKTTSQTLTETFDFDDSLLNTGDSIGPLTGEIRAQYYPWRNGTEDFETSQSGDAGTIICKKYSWYSQRSYSGCYVKCEVNTSPFTYGTSRTDTTSFSGTVPTSTEGDLSISAVCTITYDGAKTITMSLSVTRGEPTKLLHFASGDYVKREALYANSSQSILGNPLYIDLDIGEAYKIENGKAISINEGVVIPALLPKLIPKANVITTDDITELQVVPRWWKI